LHHGLAGLNKGIIELRVRNLLGEAGEGDAHLHHGLAGLKQELSNTGIFTIYGGCH
jgi:hypothetical protein